MMMPETGSMPKVSGRRSATPETGPIPGSAPMRVPRVTPAAAITRLNGVNAMREAEGEIGEEVHQKPSTPTGNGTRSQ